MRHTLLLWASLVLASGAAAQEQECPSVRVGETRYAQLVQLLRDAGIAFREIPPDRESGAGRGLFVQGSPLCPGFGRQSQGTVHYFVPGTTTLALMIANFRYTPEGHWAMEQLLDERYAPMPAAPADPVRPDVLAAQITKTWSRDALVVRLRRDAPDVPPLYTGVEYRRPDLVAEMERAVRASPGAR